jgi:glutaredoxin
MQQNRLSVGIKLCVVVAIAAIAIGCASTNQTSTASNDGAISDTASSTESAATPEQALAQHLTETGAKMYGAFWCPHCADQKEMFGAAVEAINYVECDPEGENAQPQQCIDAGIEGYPTWEINGELYPGVRSLEELANLSNYSGSTNFSTSQSPSE